MVSEAGNDVAISDQPSAIRPEEEEVVRIHEYSELPRQPSRYLLQVHVPERDLSGDTLAKGLIQMGWSRVVLDQSVKPEVCRQVVAEIEQPFVLAQGPTLFWSLIRPLTIDVFGELEYKLKPLDVEKGTEYEMLFVARMKSHPTREATIKALEEMGFDMTFMSALKRDMRIPGYPGASATLWLGVGYWTGPTNYVNADDAFYFEEVRAVPSRVRVEPPGEQGPDGMGEGND